jgi:hypothetical protein
VMTVPGTDTVTVSAMVMAEIVDTLERVGCQYWACNGPDTEPVDMQTCYRCSTLWDLRQTLK